MKFQNYKLFLIKINNINNTIVIVFLTFLKLYITIKNVNTNNYHY